MDNPVEIERRTTRQVKVGSVAVGGDAPISVQSMTTTKTADVEGTLAQIYALAGAGCDIVRCTCNEEQAAEGLAQIVPRSPGPDHRRHPLPVPPRARGDGGRGAGAAAQPGQHPQARAHQGGRRGGARPRDPDPHRGERGEPRPRPLRAPRRCDARGARRVGAEGARLLPRSRLRRREDLGEGVERAADDRGVPDAVRHASTTRCTSASPRPGRRPRAS